MPAMVGYLNHWATAAPFLFPNPIHYICAPTWKTVGIYLYDVPQKVIPDPRAYTWSGVVITKPQPHFKEKILTKITCGCSSIVIVVTCSSPSAAEAPRIKGLLHIRSAVVQSPPVGLATTVVRKPSLSALKKRCFQFTKEHKDWRVNDWKRAMWSNESLFQLHHADGKMRISSELPQRFKLVGAILCKPTETVFCQGPRCFGRIRHFNGRESIEDEPHSGRPSVSKTAENAVRVRDLVRSDHEKDLRQNGSEKPFSVDRFLGSKNIPVAPHPPYSPDLSPCDFFLFPKLKNHLKGHHFGTLENIQTAVTDQQKAIPISEFQHPNNVSSTVWHQKAVTLKETMFNCSENESATGSSLNYQELYSNESSKLNLSWRTPPVHHWYTGTSPGTLLEVKSDCNSKTALARLKSSHLQCLSFERGRKIHTTCKKCCDYPASPEYILKCVGLSEEDLTSVPHLVIDFLTVNNLMELI
ncbi:uncharacterized protein TNCV_1959461 [Trichonephila clavipes]|nr:uncharacterized protein TNCV_1959461 [Trichonephila clavipes]